MSRKKDSLKDLKETDKNTKEVFNNFHSKLFEKNGFNELNQLLEEMNVNPSEFNLRDQIREKCGYDVDQVLERAMQEKDRKVNDILSLKVSPPSSYEESDQSPLSGEASQFLRNQWASGMDYRPHDPNYFHLSAWLKTLYSGDYEGMMKILQGKTDEEIRKLLSVRETLYNFPAIFHPIIGARNLALGLPENPEVYRMSVATLKIEREWVKILRKLIALGADVSARDFAGFTPLHHCVQRMGNEVTLTMAEILLKAGADVNAQCRFGDTPLLDCTRADKFDFMELLLKYGACPDIKDNNGYSPHYVTRMYPRAQRMFGEANKKRLRQMREKMKEEAGGSLRSCALCQFTGAENKKCTGCYFVYYCSQHCQRQAWSSHKKDCKEIRGEFKDCIVDLQSYSGRSHLSNKFYVRRTGDLPKKSHFVVKVQLPLGKLGKSSVDEVSQLGAPLLSSPSFINICLPGWSTPHLQ